MSIKKNTTHEYEHITKLITRLMFKIKSRSGFIYKNIQHEKALS